MPICAGNYSTADNPRPRISGEEMMKRLRGASKEARQAPAIWEKRSRR